jgi:hypothetical protein
VGATTRASTTSLVSGKTVAGDRGLGVLGSQVPSTGDHGPGYLYNDITLPGEADDEFYGLILTVPSAGTFFAYEDSSFTLTDAPDGNYTFTYEGFKNGVSYGEATVNITIGSGGAVGPMIRGQLLRSPLIESRLVQ